jgi:hypothetical protein
MRSNVLALGKRLGVNEPARSPTAQPPKPINDAEILAYVVGACRAEFSRSLQPKLQSLLDLLNAQEQSLIAAAQFSEKPSLLHETKQAAGLLQEILAEIETRATPHSL